MLLLANLFIFIVGLTAQCNAIPTVRKNFNRPVAFTMADSLLKFGDKLVLKIKMPTKDKNIAAGFLSKPHELLEATWDKEKLVRSSIDTYSLRMASLSVPGLDVTPEIDVTLKYENGLVRLNSGKWTLLGSGAVLKDNRFMQSFDIKLVGELRITGDQVLEASGWVTYAVQGEKPAVFNNLPPFVLEAAIKLIQDAAANFATTQFTQRFSTAFRSHLLSELKQQQNHIATK